ncbi:MAG TPA: pyroglutamyl-peptidase I [Myxococcales bacterium LLY-WYZ-16_1]|nr:pyroglutamyl-peptidase I [Myxococcales bacterium LLY-WYZ-16_1]
MQVTVTGFEPFAGVPHNPSEAVVRALPSHVPGLPEVWLRTAILPVDTIRVRPRLKELWDEQPGALIHLGVAANATTLALETRAENRLDFRVADNGGATPRQEPVEPGGPVLVGTRLPVDLIADWLDRSGVPARMSRSAGTFLCNQVMYLSLRALPASIPTGFVHLPPDETLAEALGRQAPFSSARAMDGVLATVRWTAELALARRDDG